ncbi:hypothetical protein YC2023_063744 [Brassica napus]
MGKEKIPAMIYDMFCGYMRTLTLVKGLTLQGLPLKCCSHVSTSRPWLIICFIKFSTQQVMMILSFAWRWSRCRHQL